MILTCPNCRKTLKVPDNAAGKKVRCPGCLEILPVPAADVGGGGGISTSIARPAANPKPQSSASAPPSTVPSGRSASSSSTAGSKPAAMPERRSASTPDGATSDARGSAPAHSKSKQATSRSGAGGPSRTPKRPKPEEPSDFDNDYESGYESSTADPWSSGPSWEEPNLYAAPTYEASSSRSKKNAGGSMKLAGIGLLVQAWSYIGIIVVFFAMIAIGVIVALTRTGGSGGMGPNEVGIMFAGLGFILLIPLGIAILVGYVLCVFVPPKSNARTPMMIALALSVLMFLFSILQAVGTAFNSPGAVIAIAGLRLAMWIGQIVCFCLFMKAAATFIRRDDLAQSANIVMYGLTIGPFLVVVGAFLAGLLGQNVAPAVGIAMFIGVAVVSVGILVVWVMQLFLMFRLGTAMKNY